jgi:hypothetical protein
LWLRLYAFLAVAVLTESIGVAIVEQEFMWIIKAALLFLLIWGVWYVCWTVLFAAWDIVHGFAPFSVVIGAFVALLIVGKYFEHRKRKRGSF